MVERLLIPVFALVEGVELVRPLDPDLVLVRNVNLFVTGLVLVSFRIVAPNILSAKLDAGLLGGRSDEGDQGLNVDDSSKIRKTISLEMSKVMFSSRLKLDIAKVGATVSKFLRSLTRVMEDQNLSGGIAEGNRDPTFLAFVWLDLVEHLAVALGVETQDSPIVD